MAGRTIKEVRNSAKQTSDRLAFFYMPNDLYNMLRVMALNDKVSVRERVRSIVIEWFDNRKNGISNSELSFRSLKDIRASSTRKVEHYTSFLLPDGILDELKEMSKADGISNSERIRAIVIRWFEIHSETFENQGLKNVSNMVKNRRIMQRRAADHAVTIQIPDDIFQFLTTLAIEDGIPTEERIRTLVIEQFMNS